MKLSHVYFNISLDSTRVSEARGCLTCPGDKSTEIKPRLHFVPLT